ncbi:MAG: tetratricopeptide repeat protein [Xanthomonadales bacterium]|nr:tetratricopeptide repeat protein [Xanthomonadales bacterium]
MIFRKHRLRPSLLALLVLASMLSACANRPAIETPRVPPLVGHPPYTIDDVDPLELSDEMKQFVDTHLGGLGGDDNRSWRLAWAMLDRNVFDFQYDPHITLTASDAFRARRGNCLTFSNMVIAMAREAGMRAWYREVEIEPEWNSLDETLLVSMHVNAATSDRNREYIVDVSGRTPRPDERHRRISDEEAKAQYYNNLGAQSLVVNDLSKAYAYLRKAEQTRPGLAFVWSNLGVVYRRNGQTDDAVLAYETALALDGRHSVALNNLYTIYDEDGDFEKAEAIQAKVEKNRRRNPYYLHYLAETAFAERDLEEAINYAKRAIRLEDDEYRFHYTLAQLRYQEGETQRAREALDRALRLAPEWVDTGTLILPGKIPEPTAQ